MDALGEAGLDSIDAVFVFDGGEDLGKANLAEHRRRTRFALESTGKRYYLAQNQCHFLQIRRSTNSEFQNQ